MIGCIDRDLYGKKDTLLKYCREFYFRAILLLGQGPHPTLSRRSFKKDTRMRLLGCVEEIEKRRSS